MKNQIKTLRASALLLLLFVTGVGYSQSLTGVVWQLQNPDIVSNSEIIRFSSDGGFSYTTLSLQSGQSEAVYGTWNLSGGYLSLTTNGQSYLYKLNWTSVNKIKLIGSKILVYAKSGSDEDWFITNYFNSTNNSYNNYNNSNGYNSQSSQTCYTCYGTGSCKVCGGSGTYSAYGYSSTCSACSGTGKCWHCHGSGKQ